ncbi:carbon storage regulator CsrA [Spirochaetia bacterium 38H-sp]|uniref:Translational regulator CsrA n=1 Tax=Rarispira pelagica TaxID=3141764 RepID=A0ABU9UF18_9SPIR
MLILSRKKGESIILDDNITITVVEVKGDNIKLGIEAPENIKIYREEVYKAIQEENKTAAVSNLDLENIYTIFEQPQKTKK